MQNAHTTASPDDIDISKIFSDLRRGLSRVTMFAAICGLGTLAVTSMMAPQYLSEARILIDNEVPDPTKPLGSGGGEGQSPDREAVTSQVEVIKSRDVARQVARDLKLADNANYNPAVASGLKTRLLTLFGLSAGSQANEEQNVLTAYYKNLRVYNIRDSRVIAVEFRDSDPNFSAHAANTLADSYIAWQKSERLKRDQGAGEVIGEEIVKLRQELSAAEIELERVRAETGQVRTALGGGEGVTVSTQQLTEINTKLNEVRSQRAEAEARSRIVREMLKTNGQIETSPDVLRSPVMQQLEVQKAQVDRQIAELSATLLPAHPRMRQLRSERISVDRQVAAEARKMAASLENETSIASAREAALKAELDRLMSKATSTGPDLAQVRQLEATVRSKRGVLEAYERRHRDAITRGTPTAVPAFAKVISRAQPAATPVFPKPVPHSLLAAAAAFTVGLALTIAGSMLRGARSAPAARDPLPRSVRAGPQPSAIRQVRAAPNRAIPSVKGSPASESVAAVLVARAGGQGGHRTLVTGSGRMTEISQEAGWVAEAIAAEGKSVLLVDCTAAARALASRFGIDLEHGFDALLSGDAAFSESIRETGIPGLSFSGVGSPEGIAAVPAEALLETFDTLDGAFEHLIVVAGDAVARDLLEKMAGGFDAAVAGGVNGQVTHGRIAGVDIPGLEVLALPVGPVPAAGRPARARSARAPAHA